MAAKKPTSGAKEAAKSRDRATVPGAKNVRATRAMSRTRERIEGIAFVLAVATILLTTFFTAGK